MKDFKGKVAVVTGGNSGIGLGIARALAQEGCNIAVVGMQPEKTEKAAAELAAMGVKAKGYICDVSKRDPIEAMADQLEKDLGPADIVVANAGVSYQGRLHEHKDSDWDWVMSVNLRGVYLTSSVFLRRFVDSKRPGHMVLMGSEQCFGLPDPQFCMHAYTTAKHALLGMADAMRQDYAKDKIDVSIVCPGPVATEIWSIERDRPDEFGGATKDFDPSGANLLKEIGMNPDQVGAYTVAGLKAGQFYIITHDYIRDLIEARHTEGIKAADWAVNWAEENT